MFDTKDYSISHIEDSPENLQLILNFEAGNDAEGLALYLKKQSVEDERQNESRTYLLKDKMTEELAGYFSLRTGLITIKAQNESFNTIPAVELANFAINQKYRDSHPDVLKLGSYAFENFILPLVRFSAEFVGVKALYIYALPKEKLIEHYKTMGFSRLLPKQEKFVQNHIKPKYDEGCIFMYQIL